MKYPQILKERFKVQQCLDCQNMMVSDVDILCSNHCRDYIEKCWEYWGKTLVFKSIKDMCEDFKIAQPIDRYCHMVYTYLLGIHLYCKNAIVKQYVNQKLVSYQLSDYDFKFLWLLICFGHDAFYQIEGNSGQPCLQETKGYSPIGVPRFYTKELLLNYNNLKMNDGKGPDHGIFAGFILLQKLNSIWKEKQTEENDCLSWGPKEKKMYKLAANIIACHNVWLIKEDSTDVSKYTGVLDRLIIRKGKGEKYKIQLKKHPLLFLFCLVDTIEPYKRFLKVECLDGIDISVSDSEIIISQSLDCSCAIEYMNSIRKLDEWLTDVRVEGKNIKLLI